MNKTIIRSALAIIAAAAIIGTPLAFAADATSTAATSTVATSTPATSTIATTTATTTAPSATTTQTITNNAQGDVSSTTSTVSSDGLQESSSTTSIGGTATSTDAGPSITTGDAVTAINISNVINTAIINSNGLISLLNLFAPILGDVNFSMLNFASTCALCSTGSITDVNNNSSTLANTLNATSSSGANDITNNGNSTATIATGNAFAAGNILNIANSSFVNANYLLLVLNNFNSLNGDIVLPGPSFFKNTTSTPAVQAATSSVANNNTSTIENGLDVKAEAGGNTASTTGAGSIASGAATAVTNAINLANTNIMGSEPIFVLVRVFGTWNGKILGTPPGLEWAQTPDGLLLAGPGVNSVLSNSTSDVKNNNSADIKNDLHVYALTGDNHIGGTGSGTITTGNATAVGNSINIINTNIVGQNVLFALINIFGNWQGNLTFGAPDVWVGAQADVTSNPLTAGSIIHYHVTVENRGSSDASNIAVKSIPTDPTMETVTNAGLGTMTSSSSLSWMIPSLAPGESKILSFDETMGSPAAMPGQFTDQISANETEKDANPADNTDTISFATGWVIGGNQHGSELKVNESNSATSTLPPGSTVHYTIDFKNTDRGGIAYGMTLHQTLYDPMGRPIGSGTWPVGRVNPGDEYQIKFDIQFPSGIPSGYYTSIASLEGVDDYGVARATSSASVYIVNPSDQPHAPTVVKVPAPILKKGTSVKTTSVQSQAKPKAAIHPAAIKFPFIAATAQAVATGAPLP